MGLKDVVLTSADRDDLRWCGAATSPRSARSSGVNPGRAVEALTPDFQGVPADVATVVDSGLDVFAENVETVRPLPHPGRDPRASYAQTPAVPGHAKQHRRGAGDEPAKTSLTAASGDHDEILETMRDLRAVGVDLRTTGEYLRPTVNHLAVERFVTLTNSSAIGNRHWNSGSSSAFPGRPRARATEPSRPWPEQCGRGRRWPGPAWLSMMPNPARARSRRASGSGAGAQVVRARGIQPTPRAMQSCTDTAAQEIPDDIWSRASVSVHAGHERQE